MDVLLLPFGFIVGLLVGLTGVGGGALMTPGLILFGVPAAVAVGTDLVYAATTKSAGVLLHHLKRNIHWPIVGALCAGSIPSACATLWIMNRWRVDGGGYDDFVMFFLGLALVLTAWVILLQRRFGSTAKLNRFQRNPGPCVIVCGCALGILVSSSSVGAGALGAAILLYFYRDIPVAGIVGTDLAHAMILATVTGFGHWKMGAVQTDLLVPLITGSLPGVYIGARLSGYIPDAVLAPLMSSVLLLMGVGFSLSVFV